MRIDPVRLSRLFWALVLISLPVTSFRHFPFLGNETMVRPLAFYPLAILVLILAWRMFKGTLKFKASGTIALLGLFLIAAFVSTAWGWAFAPIPMHGQDYLGRTLRAWVTLAGGIVFFISTILMNQTEDDLRYSLKWLYIGLAISIVWGGIQMVSYLTGFPDRVDLNKLQSSFSIRRLLIKEKGGRLCIRTVLAGKPDRHDLFPLAVCVNFDRISDLQTPLGRVAVICGNACSADIHILTRRHCDGICGRQSWFSYSRRVKGSAPGGIGSSTHFEKMINQKGYCGSLCGQGSLRFSLR